MPDARISEQEEAGRTQSRAVALSCTVGRAHSASLHHIVGVGMTADKWLLLLATAVFDKPDLHHPPRLRIGTDYADLNCKLVAGTQQPRILHKYFHISFYS